MTRSILNFLQQWSVQENKVNQLHNQFKYIFKCFLLFCFSKALSAVSCLAFIMLLKMSFSTLHLKLTFSSSFKGDNIFLSFIYCNFFFLPFLFSTFSVSIFNHFFFFFAIHILRADVSKKEHIYILKTVWWKNKTFKTKFKKRSSWKYKYQNLICK